jgi:type IV secretory pathway ATPase VirB11/archaellum biosynthesis ATPase
LTFTFRATSAGSEILINPVAAQTISLKATVDAGASIVTAGGTGIKNTAATNVVGDFITLIADGGTEWHMIGQSGIWASQ